MPFGIVWSTTLGGLEEGAGGVLGGHPRAFWKVGEMPRNSASCGLMVSGRARTEGLAAALYSNCVGDSGAFTVTMWQKGHSHPKLNQIAS